MRILVVEDDRKVAAFLAKGLREEQYAVDVSPTGPGGLEQAEVNSYDAIVLDVMLPGLNGFSICRTLRSRGVLTPILMLTAKDTLRDKLEGLDGGADDYLTKPFSFEELLARIRALLRRGQDYKVATLKAGDLELDPVSRRVIRAGRRIALTGKEYALLEYLLRNKGRILSPTVILEHVWDMNYDGPGNVVNVYINHLREKIDKAAAVKLIATVRGQGFRIEDPNEGL